MLDVAELEAMEDRAADLDADRSEGPGEAEEAPFRCGCAGCRALRGRGRRGREAR